MIKLYELRQFATFGETGTLSEAACNKPQYKKIENELGVIIFERSKNKISLNNNGRYLLELTKKLLSDVNVQPFKVREYAVVITVVFCRSKKINNLENF